jgi:NADPH:quinone reductase-like Zn-dependent oxidoreductase
LTPPWEPNGAGKYKDQGILVVGGSSCVGQFGQWPEDTIWACLTKSQPVLQFARLSGFSTIVTTASLHNADYVKSLGATHVIDRHADVVAEAGKIFSTPPSVVFDAISEDQEVGWKILGPNGTLVLVLPPTVETSGENKRFVRALGSVHTNRDMGRRLFSKVTELLQSGDIKASAPVENFHKEGVMTRSHQIA